MKAYKFDDQIEISPQYKSLVAAFVLVVVVLVSGSFMIIIGMVLLVWRLLF